MARPLRIELAGRLYHVTSRGDRREAVYRDDADRTAWLDLFGEARPPAQARYADFVGQGIGGASVWDDLRHRVFLGSAGFAESG